MHLCPDMTPERVRAAIISRLGPPQRNVGSGLRIEQWDIAGGALTFHPYRGPTFSDPKTKKTLYLLPTANPVQVNLLQTYDMTTLPDPTNHRTRFWIGTLKIGTDQTYQFVESFQHIHEPRLHTETFFLRHPMGKVAIRYANSISSGTLLETMPEAFPLARGVFQERHHMESFAALFEESLSRKEMRIGEVITAEVVRIDDNFVVVNAGLKSESYIPKRRIPVR